MIKILVAEDEQRLRTLLCGYLTKEGYHVDQAGDGEEALSMFYNNDYSLVLLDVMMPRKDGFQVCSEIRQSSEVPIMLLTARNTEFDELMGFDYGADEYISKPFSPKILIMRVKNLLKRSGALQEKELVLKNVKISYREHAVYDREKSISLTPREYDLLCYLTINRNIVLTREQILQAVWGIDYEGDERTVDTHIKCLRLKLPNACQQIKTVRKCGYCFEEKE